MLQHSRILAGVAAVVLIASCSDPTTKPIAPPPNTSPDASVVGPLAARAIALAMADPQIRQQILGDMRDSPFSEHKLVLQDYLATTAGTRLLEAIQRAGIDANNLDNTLRAIGPIQFYVPNTKQRSTWGGTADVLITSSLPQTPTVGFSPAGEAVPLALDKRTVPSGTLFILEWAEPMFRRWAGPTAAAETIQLPDESQIGSGRVVRDASGRIIGITDDMDSGLSGITASAITASVSAGEPAGTYLTTLTNESGVCDHFFCDDLEFEFRSTATDNPNLYTSAQLSGISTDQGSVWQGLWQVHTSRAINGVRIETAVWEVDGDSPYDPFYCVLAHPACSPGISNWPYMDGQVWAFILCEDTPQGCVDQFGFPEYPDLGVGFTDRSTPVTTQVTVAPSPATISKYGPGVPLTATVRDQYGDIIPGKVVSWSSTNTAIATVASTGNLTATATGTGGGQVEIRATVDGVTGSSAVTVLAVATVTVSPSSASICLNTSQTLTATARDQQGNVVTAGTATWSSSNSSFATVTSTGSRTASVTSVGAGQPTITATVDGINGTSSVATGPCLPTPTSCTLEYIPTPHYLRVVWANADASASTQVEIWSSPGGWQLVGTDSPGVTQHFHVVGPGLYYARVRHVKSGYLPSNYCETNSKTV